MIIVDDHLALLAIAGQLPDLGQADGPIATTWTFQFRLARALADTARSGPLSRRLSDSEAALRRVLAPRADRLVVLDPRTSATETVRVAATHRANLLLAELVGGAITRSAAIRVSVANQGRTWLSVMDAEGVDFAAIDV